jgi:hypothetical protein
MVRKAFDKFDEPVNIDMDPEEALKVLLQVEHCEPEPEPE